jgi:demethylmenaquinone methyltransferase/2-methoxy-6-polyprenyl-1,4-benzoquinol methylase
MEIPTKFAEKAKFVLRVFTDVETEYDFLLHLMTLTFDSAWRRRMLSNVDFTDAIRVLDLACGTGLVAFELGRQANAASMVVGLDLGPAMLRIANRNRLRKPSNCPIEFVRAVGEFLPFRDGFFNYVTIGLALRNFADKLAMFRESRRVLTRSGWFLSVDFVRPDNRLVWFLYGFHIFRVLPALGRLVSSHWKETLVYLANSILISTPPKQTCKLLGQTGFRHTLSERVSLGIVVSIGAQK